MLSILFLVALITFTLAFLLSRLISEKQLQQISIERFKARAGLQNHFKQAVKTDKSCHLCAIGLLFRPKTSKELEKIKGLLVKAGYRDEKHLGAYLLMKFSFVIVVSLVALGLWSWFHLQPSLAFVLVVFSLVLPERLLIHLGNKRLSKISQALPDFLDMSNICMNAGLSYLVAIKRVSEELAETYPEICYEFNYFLEQIQVGVPRIDALKQLSVRNPANEINELVQVLTQNEKLGSPIGKAINDFSRRIYKKRENVMEEKAAKTSAKMAVIIMPFLMVPYFILMLGEKMVLLGRNW